MQPVTHTIVVDMLGVTGIAQLRALRRLRHLDVARIRERAP